MLHRFGGWQKNNLSVRNLYSTCTEAELDALVTEIKARMPNAGYRLVKGTLKAQGHRLGWDRVKASMHRVDSIGILSRRAQLGCVVRRTYSVPCPKYLVHIETNHKLIRWAFVCNCMYCINFTGNVYFYLKF